MVILGDYRRDEFIASDVLFVIDLKIGENDFDLFFITSYFDCFNHLLELFEGEWMFGVIEVDSEYSLGYEVGVAS